MSDSGEFRVEDHRRAEQLAKCCSIYRILESVRNSAPASTTPLERLHQSLDVNRAFPAYLLHMILSYRDKQVKRFAFGDRVKKFQSFADQASKRLAKLNAAPDLATLRTLPGNRFEAPGGSRKGQFSVRINQQ